MSRLFLYFYENFSIFYLIKTKSFLQNSRHEKAPISAYFIILHKNVLNKGNTNTNNNNNIKQNISHSFSSTCGGGVIILQSQKVKENITLSKHGRNEDFNHYQSLYLVTSSDEVVGASLENSLHGTG